MLDVPRWPVLVWPMGWELGGEFVSTPPQSGPITLERAFGHTSRVPLVLGHRGQATQVNVAWSGRDFYP